MTQFESQFESQFDAVDPGEQKTSGLAIGSLVCSLICCVPVTTIPGILLGIAAMVSIGNNPARKGKGLAVAGILLGVIFTAGHVYVYPKLYEFAGETFELLMNGPNDALVAGFAGDPAEFRSNFYGTGAQAHDAEAQAFIDTLRSRYGEFQSCQFDEQAQPSSAFGQRSTVFPYILTFDNATVDADVQIIWVDERTGDKVFKFGWVIVHDADLGDLRYPAKKLGPGAAQPPVADPPASPESPAAPQPPPAPEPADTPSPTGDPEEGNGG